MNYSNNDYTVNYNYNVTSEQNSIPNQIKPFQAQASNSYFTIVDFSKYTNKNSPGNNTSKPKKDLDFDQSPDELLP